MLFDVRSLLFVVRCVVLGVHRTFGCLVVCGSLLFVVCCLLLTVGCKVLAVVFFKHVARCVFLAVRCVVGCCWLLLVCPCGACWSLFGLCGYMVVVNCAL